jgi:hypothetical protein
MANVECAVTLLGDDHELAAGLGEDGLGSWLKAAMIDKVLRERPQVTLIRTGNAQSNAPMLAINFELGFKPRASEYNWQISRDKVKAYLAEHDL